MKQGSKIYIEVPAPDCDRQHELNLNHYSILGANQLAALLQRTGFDIESFNNLEFDLNVPTGSDDEAKVCREKYFVIMARKQRSLDVK